MKLSKERFRLNISRVLPGRFMKLLNIFCGIRSVFLKSFESQREGQYEFIWRTHSHQGLGRGCTAPHCSPSCSYYGGGGEAQWVNILIIFWPTSKHLLFLKLRNYSQVDVFSNGGIAGTQMCKPAGSSRQSLMDRYLTCLLVIPASRRQEEVVTLNLCL